MNKLISSSEIQLLLSGGTIFGKILKPCRIFFFVKTANFIRLSEGFATLLSYQITEGLHPEWQQRHFFNIRELQNAFRYDARDVTRSMTPTPSLVTPAEIRSTFDTIAYDKCEENFVFNSS